LDGHVFDAVVSGAAYALEAGGFAAHVLRTRESMAAKRECLKHMLSIGVDGLIIEGIHTALPNPNADIYREIETRGLPVVFTNSYHPDVHAAHVTANDRQAVAGLVDHLAGLGHTRIGGVFCLNQLQGLWRYQGFLDGLDRNRLEYVDERILFTSMDEMQLLFDQRYNAAREKLEECTAMVCFNDEMARFLEVTLLRSGIKVPGRMSVTGVDCIPYPGPTGSVLTTVAHPKEEMGTSAAKLMLQMLLTGRDAENVVLGMPFVQGTTTAPPERG
jgi:GntR family transcriptional regulator of arabinose operon